MLPQVTVHSSMLSSYESMITVEQAHFALNEVWSMCRPPSTANKTKLEKHRGNIYNVKWNRVRDDSLIARLNGTHLLHSHSVTLGSLSPVLYSLRSDLFIFQFKVGSAAHPGTCHENTYRYLKVQSPLRQGWRAVLHGGHETSHTPIHSANQKWPLACGTPTTERAIWPTLRPRQRATHTD